MKGGVERCGQAPWENELLGLPVLSLCVLPDCFSDPNLLRRTGRSPHPPVTDRMVTWETSGEKNLTPNSHFKGRFLPPWPGENKFLCKISCIKKQRHHFADKGPHSQSYSFSSSQVWMWELDHKEGWAPKNWCFQIVVLEKTLESPSDSKEARPVNPKGNETWILTGRTDGWSWNFNTLATWCKKLIHWKRSWCWEKFMGGGDMGQWW